MRFPPFLPDFPSLCCPSLSHLSGPAAFIPWMLKVNFFPHLPPGLSDFEPWHYIYTFMHLYIYAFIHLYPVPSHLLNICQFLVGVCMAAPPAHTGWLIPHSTQRTRLWGSIAGCPMSHCASGGSQGADTSSRQHSGRISDLIARKIAELSTPLGSFHSSCEQQLIYQSGCYF